MDIATFEQIATVLSKLTVSYNNLLTEYYNLFYNPTPMDVTIQYYDEEGELSTIEIPNRAKDRRFILNGKGAPEDIISGSKGSIYQDLTNGEIYLKQAGSGISGWSKIISESDLETVIKQGVGSPEGAYTAPKGTLYVDKQNASLYIKSTATSSEGWLLISANTNDLALRDLSNLTEEGEDHFANPSLSNLDTRGRAILDGKENINNKVTVLTEDCTDVQYPSAKLLYDVIVGTALPLANRDLSNLTEVGEEHFLGKPQTGDGVLYAPNGVTSASGGIISIPNGTVLLLANGRNQNGTLANVRVVTYSRTLQVTGTSYEGYAFYDATNKIILVREADYYRQESQPTGTSSRICVWYNTSQNLYYVKEPNSSEWSTIQMARIAQFTVGSAGTVTSFTPVHPVRVATEDDLNIVRSELKEAEKEAEQHTDSSIINTLKAMYPIGSTFMATTSTCPMAAFFGTWTLRASQITINTGTTAPKVKGTGAYLGLTNNGGSWSAALNLYRSSYNEAILSNGGRGWMYVTTDPNQSGMVVDMSSNTFTVNIWERTA